jgi:hypothetical protein
MKLNAVSLFYLFFRLLPLILISYFCLTSFFDQDFKAIIYLVGLLFTTLIVIFIGNVLPFRTPLDITGLANKELCKIITFDNISDISKLPLSQTVFGYTFVYLLVGIIKNDLIKQNINTIIFFSILILIDIIWNVKNTCFTIWQLGTSLIISGALGLLWGFIINSTNHKHFIFLTGINNKEICRTPTKTAFKCNPKRKKKNTE